MNELYGVQRAKVKLPIVDSRNLHIDIIMNAYLSLEGAAEVKAVCLL